MTAKERAKQAVSGFDDRCNQILQVLKGKPVTLRPIDPPYEPGRPRLPRGYSYSVMNHAMRVYLLEEEEYYEDVRRALQENCYLYIEDQVLRDDRDSFYWSIDILCRIIEFFGREGTRRKGLLDWETEQLCYRMMYMWACNNSRLEWAETEKSKTWYVWESENHHIQRFSAAWHITRLLARQPDYAQAVLDDGGTCDQHHRAWTAYAKAYLRERARKSLFIETGNSFYGLHTLKGIYNFYDFAQDPDLHRLAGNLLSLYWAAWAQEQIDGVRGGGKARIYPGENSLKGTDPMRRLAWFYLGTGEMLLPTENEFTVLTSGYRLPQIVAEMALDTQGRGTYEIQQRPFGLAADGCWRNEPDYHADTEWGGILRYSYCTPSFILGSLMVESRPLKDWMLISSQNRWQGVIFAGHQDCRIVPQCRTSDMMDPEIQVKRAYNQHWALQKKGTLITQKLREADGTDGMRVFFSHAGLTAPEEEGGWLFVEAPGAYAAVRILQGEYTFEQDESGCDGIWAECENEYSPVILEVADKQEYTDFAAFRQAVHNCAIEIMEGRLTYRSLGGHLFEMDLANQKQGLIDGQKMPARIPQAYESPFVWALWNADTVTLQKDEESMELSFA